MSFAYMPLYTGDYRRDTSHLSCAEHGIYLLFLMHCWDTKKPLPSDERKLAGICNARSGDEIEAMRRILKEFWMLMDCDPETGENIRSNSECQCFYNKRMTEVIANAANIAQQNREAGLISAYVRRTKARSRAALNERSTDGGNLNLNLNINPNPIPEIEPTALVGLKPNSAGHAHLQAVQILTFLNVKTGRNYRPVKVNLEFIIGRLREGASSQECKQVIVRKCTEWLDDSEMSKYLRPATLFNRTKFAQYLGEVTGPSEEEKAGGPE